MNVILSLWSTVVNIYSRVQHRPNNNESPETWDKTGIKRVKQQHSGSIFSCNKWNSCCDWPTQSTLRFMKSPSSCQSSVSVPEMVVVRSGSIVGSGGAFRVRWRCSCGWGAGRRCSAGSAGCSGPCPSTARPRSLGPTTARRETATPRPPSSSSPAPRGLQGDRKWCQGTGRTSEV